MLTVAACLALLACLPQSAPALTRDTRLSSTDLTGDLAVLRAALTGLHPGLHRSLTPAQVAKRFDQLAATWSGDRTLGEAYLDLSQALADLRCGHTWASFFNQRKAVAAALFAGRNCVPFAFTWVDGAMVVTRSATDHPALVPGAVVRSIQGIPTARIRATLWQVARADGANDAKRLEQLAVRGSETRELFDVFLPLCFALPEPVTFTLECTTPDEHQHTVVVPAVTAAERMARLATTSASRPGDVRFPIDGWWARRVAPGVVLLRMDTWVAYKTKADWRGALDAFMDGLVRDRVTDLIVDLRANEGGSDCGQVLLARCIDRPVALPGHARYVRYQRVPTALDPVLDTWDDTFRDWGKAATAAPAPTLLGGTGACFRLRRDADDDPAAELRPGPGPRFAGALWVLISATNSSATFEFAAAVRACGLGTLVGQPTGGSQRGINGGCFFFLRLPRTGLEVDLPLIATVPCGADGSERGDVPDAGIPPDLLVTTTRADVAQGADPELRAVLAAIAQRGAAGSAPATGDRK